MSATPRKRAPNKTPEEVYAEAVEQVARARETHSLYLQLGKGRRSLHRLPPLAGLAVRYLDLRRISATDLEPLEGLKKTKSFESVSRSITENIDKAADADLKRLLGQKVSTFAPHLRFVLAHEKLLRRLAGDRIQFRWLHAYLDWLNAKRDPSP